MIYLYIYIYIYMCVCVCVCVGVVCVCVVCVCVCVVCVYVCMCVPRFRKSKLVLYTKYFMNSPNLNMLCNSLHNSAQIAALPCYSPLLKQCVPAIILAYFR